MKYELRITVQSDRDQACNLFTLTKTFVFGADEEPTPDQIREKAVGMKANFHEAWPHPKQAIPMLLPVDAEVRLVT